MTANHENSGHIREHSHDHGHDHNYSHTHDPEQIRAVLNRFSRSAGHLQSVRRMVEENRDCAEVLIQLSAVIAELKSTGRVLLKEHMDHCIAEAIRNDDREAVRKMDEAIDRFIR